VPGHHRLIRPWQRAEIHGLMAAIAVQVWLQLISFA
jgi:hypothetical protein